MKFPGGDSDSVLDPILLSSWSGPAEHFLVEGHGHKMLDGGGGDGEDEEDTKPDMDELDLELFAANSANNNCSSEPNNNSLAELKPLPPFTNYTGHLSINGISGHHFHTIAAGPSPPRLPPPQLDHHHHHGNNGSSTNGSTSSSSQNGSDISDHTSTAPTVYYTTDHQVSSSTSLDASGIKTEGSELSPLELGPPEIEDIARLIGTVIADTTVPSGGDTSRDSWIDLDAWIEGAVDQSTNAIATSTSTKSSANAQSSEHSVISAEALQEFVNLQFTVPQANAAAQSMYHHGALKQRDAPCSYMPILQGRLTKADTLAYMVAECTSPSSSTAAAAQPYMAHSPPSHVVSTSADLQVRYNTVHSSTRPSPELQVGYPHTTTPNKKSKSRNKSKSSSGAAATSTIVYSEGALGKEKPVHRCTICNRGFLNKSNIKVHLRTHTGEKPFRCEVCGKAFRQRAHLIKHAQIHKRIGRD